MDMTDDIVTRLRELREVLMGNPIMAREVQEAMDEIERLQAEVSGLLEVGNALLKLAAADSKCQCRREWVCHRCQAIDAWESARGERRHFSSTIEQ